MSIRIFWRGVGGMSDTFSDVLGLAYEGPWVVFTTGACVWHRYPYDTIDSIIETHE